MVVYNAEMAIVSDAKMISGWVKDKVNLGQPSEQGLTQKTVFAAIG